jgi:mannose-1-phosphate guanylyltransferase
MSKNYMLIMAGGGGTRFWPLSRKDTPKQFINLSGNDALINETIERCAKIIPPERAFIVTNKDQSEAMERVMMPEVPRGNILYEPVGRNTAPCILYAAIHICKKHGDGVLCVFPSDHYITEGGKFLDTLSLAADVAEKSGKVVTIGIKPTFPATGYGYVRKGGPSAHNGVFELDRFVEKPDFGRAQGYVESGEYFWNSGMFVWKVSLVLELYKRFLPRIYNMFMQAEEAFATGNEQKMLAEIYPKLDNISVDYGIMERVDDALIIPGDFGWNDIGSWDALGSIVPSDEYGNIVKANHIGFETNECIIYSSDKFIATLGIHNTVIVEAGGAILVCAKDKAQDVKRIVETIKERGMSDLL